MTAEKSVFVDDELLAMLGSDPELLAIADAVVETSKWSESDSHRPSSSRRWVRARLSSAAAALLLLVGVIVFVSLSWSGAPSLSERALAAVGSGEVLHIKLEQTTVTPQPHIDLRDGSLISRRLQTEIWFDQGRDLKKTVIMIDGIVFEEFLETAHGGWSLGGPIYTCDWIAAHPSEAAKAGVSCAADSVSDQPTLDPVLSNFVDRYQAALESGAATEAGRGRVAGKEVEWLAFSGSEVSGRVAIDPQTYKPVAIGTPGGTYMVRLAETANYEATAFRKPEQVDPSAIGARAGGVRSETDVAPEQAALELGDTAVWLGAEWNKLRLVSVKRQQRKLILDDEARPADISSFSFTYAPVRDDGTVDTSSPVEIHQATACVTSLGWTCTHMDPTSSHTLGLPLGQDGWIGLLRRGGIYVSVWKVADVHGLSLAEIARALVPIRGE